MSFMPFSLSHIHLVGLDSMRVFDYTNDAMYLLSPLSIIPGGIADTMATALIDNSYPTVPVPPSDNVRATVYARRDDNRLTAGNSSAVRQRLLVT
jgi:hypothetical protein